ncbi:LysR family transcriptional regulator [Streptomyces sp. MST-110588]|uniref:LysR family transcriptional regulator n=1 Tax=Streptomyces sp. MST-110588 TaxID=2833628 RepID=UPI001F5CE145|nr:LysR family transcriptional regulator [Streptomyces sp. MST-110588]UNO40992.1 LysR family transcriptional regulator [Streptomyces sp. MST-110588]
MSSGLEIRELECFLALSEELHFGRTGARLLISQSRVSQLISALERRVGARLVERTSRRVRLTPLGEDFRTSLRPAYDALSATVEATVAAARGIEGRLRVGFQGSAADDVIRAVETFQARHPGCVTELIEIPLHDPFGALRRAEVDTAVVLLPVREPGLVLGPVFSRQRQTLAVSVRHPFAARTALHAEDLAEGPLISVEGPAPEYWRLAQAPEATPSGRPIPPGPRVRTLQEGLTLAAAGRGAMLLCHPTADFHGRRDLAFVPVSGLPDSALGLVWHREYETARTRAFSTALADAAPTGPPSSPSHPM